MAGSKALYQRYERANLGIYLNPSHQKFHLIFISPPHVAVYEGEITSTALRGEKHKYLKAHPIDGSNGALSKGISFA